MQLNYLANTSGLISTSKLQYNWVQKSFKIALTLASTSSVIISVMLPAKSQSSTSTPPLKSDDVVVASIDLTNPGVKIPYSFSGFSMEYGDVLNFTGRTTDTKNQVFIQLLKNLGNFGNGATPVRVGGNSTDESWWNPNGLTKPAGVKCNITNVDLASLEASLSQTGSQLILGVNLGQNQPSIAVDYIKAAQSILAPNRILSFEIGNESDLYAYHPYYKDPTTGTTVNVRPSSGSSGVMVISEANQKSKLTIWRGNYRN